MYEKASDLEVYVGSSDLDFVVPWKLHHFRGGRARIGPGDGTD